MFAPKTLLPVLAASGLVAAQTTNVLCTQSSVTISNSADAAALGSCTSVQSIVIASTATGDITIPNGVTTMAGLSASNAPNLTSISAPSVTGISGNFSLSSLPIINSLSFPQLGSVGSIYWNVVNVNNIVFTKGITLATDVFITNSQLSDLSGINLSSANSFSINNNPNLRSVTSQLGKVTGTLQISANGPNMALSLPNLTSVGSLILRDISSLSIPKLGTVTLNFENTSPLTSFAAPNLTTVGGDLGFTSNPSLTNISCPKLLTTDSLTILNNPSLLDISGFPFLSSLTGAVNVVGNYTNFVLPSLKTVKGTFNAQSSGNFSCDPFASLATNKYIAGQYHCTPSSGQISTDVNSGAQTGTMTGSVATSTGTKGAAGTTRPADILPMLSMTALVGGLVMIGGWIQFSL